MQVSPTWLPIERVALSTSVDTAPTRLSVLLVADDPLSRVGIETQLNGDRSIHIIEGPEGHSDVCAVLVAETVDEQAAMQLRRLRRDGVERTVLVVTRLDDAGVLVAIENGVGGILRRSDATPGALARTVHAVASGDGALPADLLGRFMDQVSRLQRRVLAPRGLTFSGLTEREIGVLTLLAEGHDTTEVGRRLYYSERTVKNILHDVTSRFDLRNRTHAVAFAIREGYI